MQHVRDMGTVVVAGGLAWEHTIAGADARETRVIVAWQPIGDVALAPCLRATELLSIIAVDVGTARMVRRHMVPFFPLEMPAAPPPPAAESGDCGRLQWLHARGCPLDSPTVIIAALKHAPLEVVQWLVGPGGCTAPSAKW